MGVLVGNMGVLVGNMGVLVGNMVVRALQAWQMVVAAPQARQMVVRALHAWQMVARGEREARSPWNVRKKKYRPGRPTETDQRVCRPCGARALFICDPGAACSLRSHLPLATIYRAYGASEPRPIYRACGASEPLEHRLPEPIMT
jgi:hypothetical protein